jgi:hypothetical protein
MVSVPEGIRVPVPWDRRPSLLEKDLVQAAMSGPCRR